MADLQSLLDEFMMSAAAVFSPAVAGPGTADSALATADAISNLEQARRKLVKLLDTIPREHVAVFREADWVLEHPLECRRDDQALTDCPVNNAMLDPDLAPNKPGRYLVSVQQHKLVIGARAAASGHSPVLTDTLRTSRIRTEGTGDGGDDGAGSGQRRPRKPGGKAGGEEG